MGGEGTFRELMLAQFIGVARRLFRADFTVDDLRGRGAGGLAPRRSACSCASAPARCSTAGSTIGGLVAFNALVAHGERADPHPALLWDGLQRASVLLEPARTTSSRRSPSRATTASRLRPVRSWRDASRCAQLGFRYGGPEAPPILEDVSFEAGRARRSPSSGAAARARRRSSSASRGCSSRPRAPSCSTASTCGRSTTATCAARSASCCRRTTSSPTRSRATSPSATRSPTCRA